MWDNERATEAGETENDDSNDFGDDFDDFAEEGGDDDFGNFDEAEEATPVPPLVEANPPTKAIAPSVLDSLVSSTSHSRSLLKTLYSTSPSDDFQSHLWDPTQSFRGHHQVRSSRLTLTPYFPTRVLSPLVCRR
jgi:hypothetical protein